MGVYGVRVGGGEKEARIFPLKVLPRALLPRAGMMHLMQTCSQLLTFGASQPLTVCSVILETRKKYPALKKISTCLIFLKNPFQGRPTKPFHSIIKGFKMQIPGAVTTAM